MAPFAAKRAVSRASEAVSAASSRGAASALSLGVRLSPCCSIRSHLWLPFAERLLKACENLVALKVSLEHVVISADARQHGPPSVAVSS